MISDKTEHPRLGGLCQLVLAEKYYHMMFCLSIRTLMSDVRLFMHEKGLTIISDASPFF